MRALHFGEFLEAVVGWSQFSVSVILNFYSTTAVIRVIVPSSQPPPRPPNFLISSVQMPPVGLKQVEVWTLIKPSVTWQYLRRLEVVADSDCLSVLTCIKFFLFRPTNNGTYLWAISLLVFYTCTDLPSSKKMSSVLYDVRDGIYRSFLTCVTCMLGNCLLV